MDKVRKYVFEQYKQLLINENTKELVEELEKKHFIVSKNNAAKNGFIDEDDNDTKNILIDSYIQIYIKVYEYLKRSEKNEINKEFLLTVPEASREVLFPEKWAKMLTERTSETQVHKKKGIHRCPKCKSWFTSYQQLQTASADESMRVSVICIDCNWHWKYS